MTVAADGTHQDPAAATPEPPPGVQVHGEDSVLGTRLRRPMDVVRMVVASIACLLILAFVWLAASTSAVLDQELLTASTRLPNLIVLVANAIAALGLLTLPVAVSIDMLVRRRGRQLIEALGALIVAVTVLLGLSWVMASFAPTELQIALAGSSLATDEPFLLSAGALVAFLTVARTLARPKWSSISVVVVSSILLVSFVSGGFTLAGIALTVLIGWICGLGVRYGLGTPTTRPSGERVAAVLTRAGFPVTLLQAEESTDFGRRYTATTSDGQNLHVVVFDRDLEGAGLATALWRSLRLRTSVAQANVNMRGALEQRALLAYAAQAAGVRSAPLLLASEVGPDAALLAYRRVPGVRLSRLEAGNVTDADLRSAFEALAGLQRARIAHRALSPENLVREPDGRVTLLGIGHGVVAAGDVLLRLDVAEMLASAALLTDPERTIEVAAEVMGDEELIRALPVMQPVALSEPTRRALRTDKNLLSRLRDLLLERSPDSTVEEIQLQRVRPRTLITIILGSVAGYLLLSQLASVDLVGLFRNANWAWVAGALVCSAVTYLAAAWALSGFVPEQLRLSLTIGAQLAASFATLITPPTLGAVAINLRYLQRQGVHPALATASIGASQACAFVSHVLMLLCFAIAAGTQSDLTFHPPFAAIVAVAAGAAVSLALLAIPAVRRPILGRFGPLLKQIGPRMANVVQRPRKLVEGLGGLLLMNLAYIAALYGCVAAFGGELNVAAIAVVYLTGSVVGQAAPTPGGLGAVEAAMSAGLTAAGLDGGLAVSAVLMFRFLTFWLPTIPGWFSFNAMQKRGLL